MSKYTCKNSENAMMQERIDYTVVVIPSYFNPYLRFCKYVALFHVFRTHVYVPPKGLFYKVFKYNICNILSNLSSKRMQTSFEIVKEF